MVLTPNVPEAQLLPESGWHGRASDSEFARGEMSKDTGDVASLRRPCHPLF